MVDSISRFGRMAVAGPFEEGLGPSGSSGQCPLRRWRHTWSPSADLATRLPKGFRLELDRWEAEKGTVRFSPVHGFGHLLPIAWVTGIAIKAAAGDFDDATVPAPSDQWLLFQVVRGMQEHLDRAFASSRDLFIRRAGRDEDRSRTVLPEFEFIASGIGRLSLNRFRAIGRDAAVEAGFDEPTPLQTVQFGVFALARREPLNVPGEDVSKLVRRALFDDPKAIAVGPEIIADVAKCAVEVLRGHDKDNTEEFDRRVLGSAGSFVKQVHYRLRKQHEDVTRDDVRRALLEVGWQTYYSVANCVDAAMSVTEQDLENFMNKEDKGVFQHIYRTQAYLGDLPLVLVAERMAFLKAPLLRLWENADDSSVPILHRLLWLYGEMARARRLADRRFKQPTLREQVRTHVTLDEGRDSSVSNGADLFAAVADHLRERHGLTCGCCQPAWRYSVNSSHQTTVVITGACDACTFERIFVVDRAEFVEAAWCLQQGA